MADSAGVRKWDDSGDDRMKKIPENTAVFEMDGPMFFAASDRFADVQISSGMKTLILRMRSVNDLDISAMKNLESLLNTCRSNDVVLLLSHVNEKPLAAMKRSGFYNELGEENFMANIDEAISRAEELSASAVTSEEE